MPHAERFGLFEDDGKSPICRSFSSDLDKAKRRAQHLADNADHEFFVFCFTHYVQVARLFPSKHGLAVPRLTGTQYPDQHTLRTPPGSGVTDCHVLKGGHAVTLNKMSTLC